MRQARSNVAASGAIPRQRQQLLGTGRRAPRPEAFAAAAREDQGAGSCRQSAMWAAGLLGHGGDNARRPRYQASIERY